MGEQHYTLAGISMKALPKQDDAARGGEMGRKFREEGNLNQGKRGGVGRRQVTWLVFIWGGNSVGTVWEQRGSRKEYLRIVE